LFVLFHTKNMYLQSGHTLVGGQCTEQKNN